MKIKLDKDKIQYLLIKNWSEVITYKDLNNFINKFNTNYNKIYISRFELLSKKFLIWVEIENTLEKINKTFECSLYFDGEITLDKEF